MRAVASRSPWRVSALAATVALVGAATVGGIAPPARGATPGPTSTGSVATQALLARQTLSDPQGRPLDGRGTSIAIVDTGIDPAHPAFKLPDGSTKVVQHLSALPCVTNGEQIGPYQVGPLSVPAITQTELSSSAACVTPIPSINSDLVQGGHGSMIGGLIVGDSYRLSDGTEVGGVAPGARLVVISVSTALVGIDNAFAWIVEHHDHPCGNSVPSSVCPPIRVINCSWGAEDQTIIKLQDLLAQQGVLTVWANGNSGGDGKTNNSNFEATNDRTPGVLSVADYDDRGTETRDGQLDPGSSRGLAADPRTWPDISAPGTNMISACRPYQLVCPAIETEPPRSGPSSSDVGTYFVGTGTSFSAPVVDAIVAMLFQVSPRASAGKIADAILTTAHKFDFGAPYTMQPYGGYLSSYDKGAGLIDAYAAAVWLGARFRHQAG